MFSLPVMEDFPDFLTWDYATAHWERAKEIRERDLQVETTSSKLG